MKIVVLSDLHTGTASIAQDFTLGDSTNGVKLGYLDDFKAIVEKENIKADYLIVPGDITHRAEHLEFELAALNIQKCAEILNVPAENIFFVPGNHDSHWDSEKDSTEKGEPANLVIASKYRYIANNPFFKSIKARAITGSFYEEPFFTFWSDDKTNIIGVNSAVFDTYDKKPHHGSVRQVDLNKLEAAILKYKINTSEKVNILVLHHHPITHPDLPFESADLSMVQNASQIMELSTKYNFDFVIHGHKHIPRLQLFMDAYQHPVNVFCAGSFSARIDDRFFQGVPHTFHVIEVDEFCPTYNTPQGVVKSWFHYTGHGWITHESPNGIPHTEFFGNRMDKLKLTSELEAIIKDKLSITNAVRWSEIIKINEDIRYSPRKLLDQIISDLASKLDFVVYDTPSIPDEQFILMKGAK
jgi:3',5'-cyclic AMP phosphodiesterase CpdA